MNVDRADVRLEGTVSHQFSLRPQRGNQYEEFTRVKKCNGSERELKGRRGESARARERVKKKVDATASPLS